MKKHFNKFLVVLCMIVCAFQLTACGSEKETIAYDEASVQALAEYLVHNMIIPMTAENANQLKEALEVEDIENQLKETYKLDVDGEAFFAGLDSWVLASEELGGTAEITEIKISADDEQIMADASLNGANGKTAVMSMTFTKRGKLTSCSTNVNKSFGEMMEGATLNTILGMGTVFVVLVLISLIISSFGLISKLEAKMKKKNETVAPVSAAPAPVQVVAEETDDLELIAVISAAIAAYEEANGGSGDGYVVRSIKRRY